MKQKKKKKSASREDGYVDGVECKGGGREEATSTQHQSFQNRAQMRAQKKKIETKNTNE